MARVRLLPKADNRVSGVPRQGGVNRHPICGTAELRSAPLSKKIVSHLHHAESLLFFAARSDAVVSPPPTLVRFNESRMPWVGIGGRFELTHRELTPIPEISEQHR